MLEKVLNTPLIVFSFLGVLMIFFENHESESVEKKYGLASILERLYCKRQHGCSITQKRKQNETNICKSIFDDQTRGPSMNKNHDQM